jgi:uncharacterized protein (DUF433 family)
MTEFARTQWDEPEAWSSPHREWVHRPPVDEMGLREVTPQMWLPSAPRIVGAIRRGLENPEVAKFIVCNPRIQGGTPIFIGTRIPVYMPLEFLSDVASFARTLRDFPELSRPHLLAALRLAAAVLSL